MSKTIQKEDIVKDNYLVCEWNPKTRRWESMFSYDTFEDAEMRMYGYFFLYDSIVVENRYSDLKLIRKTEDNKSTSKEISS